MHQQVQAFITYLFGALSPCDNVQIFGEQPVITELVDSLVLGIVQPYITGSLD